MSRKLPAQRREEEHIPVGGEKKRWGWMEKPMAHFPGEPRAGLALAERRGWIVKRTLLQRAAEMPGEWKIRAVFLGVSY